MQRRGGEEALTVAPQRRSRGRDAAGVEHGVVQFSVDGAGVEPTARTVGCRELKDKKSSIKMKEFLTAETQARIPAVPPYYR